MRVNCFRIIFSVFVYILLNTFIYSDPEIVVGIYQTSLEKGTNQVRIVGIPVRESGNMESVIILLQEWLLSQRSQILISANGMIRSGAFDVLANVIEKGHLREGGRKFLELKVGDQTEQKAEEDQHD
ncbi:MAG: hypothetical protein Q8Q33_03825 [Chlamydiota bacterium]|nr:hypothetical protein [Chlamydiota bacterium]